MSIDGLFGVSAGDEINPMDFRRANHRRLYHDFYGLQEVFSIHLQGFGVPFCVPSRTKAVGILPRNLVSGYGDREFFEAAGV